MSRNTYATQGRLVLAALRRRPLTYAGMLALGVGLSPWKRAVESLDESRERIERKKRRDGLITWRVVKVDH